MCWHVHALRLYCIRTCIEADRDRFWRLSGTLKSDFLEDIIVVEDFFVRGGIAIRDGSARRI